MNGTLLLFDFDGTIADTFHNLIRISNKLSSEFDFKLIKPEEQDRLKDKTAREMIIHLKVPLLKIPMIVARAKKELQDEIHSIEPIEGLREILLSLSKLGVKLGILSSNSEDNVAEFLKRHDLDFFDIISTTSKIWSKHTGIDKIIKKNGLSHENIIYIGDETRDIDAARKSGVKVAAVSWGYNSPKTLQEHNPDFLLEKPEDLVQLAA